MKSILALDAAPISSQPGFVDLTGQRFGRLTVLRYAGYEPGGARWHCRCDCGAATKSASQKLRQGKTVSCGCHRREALAAASVTHGMTDHPLYNTWASMRFRCHDVRDADYGGRGITVCDRWEHGENGKTGFECFLDDMSPRPSEAHTLDREDNDGDYRPGNCRWAVKLTQNRNRRITKMVTYAGQLMSLGEACELTGLPYKSVWYRIRHGWTEHTALTTPIGARP